MRSPHRSLPRTSTPSALAEQILVMASTEVLGCIAEKLVLAGPGL